MKFITANYARKYRVNGTLLYKFDIASRSPLWDCYSMGNFV